MASVRGGSVFWKLGASRLGLAPVQVNILVTTSTTKCRHKAMVWSVTTKARSPSSRAAVEEPGEPQRQGILAPLGAKRGAEI